ncbi:unnamed protein product [Fraxinus pennsylvanica]|uniref:Uncharacterized protein n=1 Tax=Fraxinus pennsylvanica TaxID=56036 RepID=A0AAD1Z0E8_9LAMI|nr:unnamed protein product [Fraxinus pennsylvanica]
MECPVSSSINKQVFSNERADASEESGWTAYLEDFSLNQTKHSPSSCSMDSFGSPSLVSDAAWNGQKNNQVRPCSSLYGSQFPKRLNFKNHRMSKKMSSDDLEDTASSPVNSPKVSSWKQVDANYKRSDDSISNLVVGKQDGLDNLSDLHRNNMNIADGRDIEGTDLEKKGLCLMPMSVFVNYLG